MQQGPIDPKTGGFKSNPLMDAKIYAGIEIDLQKIYDAEQGKVNDAALPTFESFKKSFDDYKNNLNTNMTHGKFVRAVEASKAQLETAESSEVRFAVADKLSKTGGNALCERS